MNSSNPKPILIVGDERYEVVGFCVPTPGDKYLSLRSDLATADGTMGEYPPKFGERPILRQLPPEPSKGEGDVGEFHLEARLVDTGGYIRFAEVTGETKGLDLAPLLGQRVAVTVTPSDPPKPERFVIEVDKYDFSPDAYVIHDNENEDWQFDCKSRADADYLADALNTLNGEQDA